MFASFQAPDAFFFDQVESLSITIVSVGSFDPITGSVASPTETVYKADGFKRSPLDKEFGDIIAGDLTFTVDQTVLGYKPQINDKAILEGVTYTVIQVLDRGGVVYSIQLRA